MELAAAHTMKGLAFVCTSLSHPEQYDVYTGTGQKVGYLRLRHGKLTVTYLPTGKLVYRHLYTDKGRGAFQSPEDRTYHLWYAAVALRGAMRGA